MRKVDRLPVQWQQRLLERDYRESILTSLQGEYLSKFKFSQDFVWKYSWSSILEASGASRGQGILSLFQTQMNYPPTLKEKNLRLDFISCPGVVQAGDQTLCSLLCDQYLLSL